MEALDLIFQRSAWFSLKFLLYGFIAIVVILFARIGYCYVVADFSATNMLPQIARYVAEDNGLITNVLNIDEDKQPYNIVKKTLDDANIVHEASGDRPNAAFHYYTQDMNDFNDAIEFVSGKIPAIRVIRPSTPGTNVCNIDSSSNSGSGVAQRGDILEIQVTVYATIHSGLTDMNGNPIGDIDIPITKKMQIPCVKYYRGMS